MALNLVNERSKEPTTVTSDGVDMTAAAVARRLDEVRALYDLVQYVARFRPSEASETGAAPAPQRSR